MKNIFLILALSSLGVFAQPGRTPGIVAISSASGMTSNEVVDIVLALGSGHIVATNAYFGSLTMSNNAASQAFDTVFSVITNWTAAGAAAGIGANASAGTLQITNADNYLVGVQLSYMTTTQPTDVYGEIYKNTNATGIRLHRDITANNAYGSASAFAVLPLASNDVLSVRFACVAAETITIGEGQFFVMTVGGATTTNGVYVSKLGDTMTGALSTTALTVGTSSGFTVNAGGSITATGLVHTLRAGSTSTLVVTNGRVGVGTASPLASLAVDYNASYPLSTSGLANNRFGIIGSSLNQLYSLNTSYIGDYTYTGVVGVGSRTNAGGANGLGVLGIGEGGYQDATGGRFVGIAYPGNAPATPAYGLRAGVSSTATANGYGVYIDAGAGGGTNWGLYQAGASDKNYFGGNVGIGTVSPASLFSVGTNSGFTVSTYGTWKATGAATNIGAMYLGQSAAAGQLYLADPVSGGYFSIVGSDGSLDLTASLFNLIGGVEVQGSVYATNFITRGSGAFTGNGGGLTNLNASYLTSGTLPSARLASDVVLESTRNTYTEANIFNYSMEINGGLTIPATVTTNLAVHIFSPHSIVWRATNDTIIGYDGSPTDGGQWLLKVVNVEATNVNVSVPSCYWVNRDAEGTTNIVVPASSTMYFAFDYGNNAAETNVMNLTTYGKESANVLNWADYGLQITNSPSADLVLKASTSTIGRWAADETGTSSGSTNVVNDGDEVLFTDPTGTTRLSFQNGGGNTNATWKYADGATAIGTSETQTPENTTLSLYSRAGSAVITLQNNSITMTGDVSASGLSMTNVISAGVTNYGVLRNEGTINAQSFVPALKAPFSTNYSVGTTDSIVCGTGTNQLLTLPSTASVPAGKSYTFLVSSTTGYGSLIVTNATGDQTILTASGLSQTVTNGQSLVVISDGTNWR